jgi:Domain of unknown function (DUF222)
MRSVRELADDARELAAVDATALPDAVVKDDILALLQTINTCHAALWRRVASFHRRDAAVLDAYRSTQAWLRAFGHLSVHAASSMLAKAELLDQLPAVSAAAQDGRMSSDHLGKLVSLAHDVGVEPIRQVQDIIAAVAERRPPEDLAQICDRVRAHANPDGPEPDPEATLARRGLTLSRSGDMVRLRGQLDLEAGAIVQTALDAVMTPPSPDDTRTAAQRRADALTELCRLPLNYDLLPQTGGNRPQVGLLITVEALLRQAKTDGVRPADWIANLGLRFHSTHSPTPDYRTPDPANPDTADHDPDNGSGNNGESGSDNDPGGSGSDKARPSTAKNEPTDPDRSNPHRTSRPPPHHNDTDPLTAAGIPPLDKGWLTWTGDIGTETAQRLSCDSILYRVIYDPATGQPLDVGRAHRTAPHWIRRALHARDRGCRWPGCTAPTPWTDAHHLTMWVHDGQTKADEMILLCRWHHVRVHEGHWTIKMNPRNGEVSVHRPNGQPYELDPTPSWLRRPD